EAKVIRPFETIVRDSEKENAMAFCGITRSEYEQQMNELIEREYAQARRLADEAFSWAEKAAAYAQMRSTYWEHGLFFSVCIIGPCESGLRNSATCLKNANVCRAEAKAHRDKAAMHERHRATVLAAGEFDPERR